MPKKILLVDDEKEFVLLMNAQLRKMGYQSIVAYDAVQGFRFALDHMPDLIVTDLQMPAGGGAGLFDNVRQHPKTSMIPVVIVTTQDSEEVRQAALASGVAGYLPKPVDHDLLVRTLKSALGEG